MMDGFEVMRLFSEYLYFPEFDEDEEEVCYISPRGRGMELNLTMPRLPPCAMEITIREREERERERQYLTSEDLVQRSDSGGRGDSTSGDTESSDLQVRKAILAVKSGNRAPRSGSRPMRGRGRSRALLTCSDDIQQPGGLTQTFWSQPRLPPPPPPMVSDDKEKLLEFKTGSFEALPGDNGDKPCVGAKIQRAGSAPAMNIQCQTEFPPLGGFAKPKVPAEQVFPVPPLSQRQGPGRRKRKQRQPDKSERPRNTDPGVYDSENVMTTDASESIDENEDRVMSMESLVSSHSDGSTNAPHRQQGGHKQHNPQEGPDTQGGLGVQQSTDDHIVYEAKHSQHIMGTQKASLSEKTFPEAEYDLSCVYISDSECSINSDTDDIIQVDSIELASEVTSHPAQIREPSTQRDIIASSMFSDSAIRTVQFHLNAAQSSHVRAVAKQENNSSESPEQSSASHCDLPQHDTNSTIDISLSAADLTEMCSKQDAVTSLATNKPLRTKSTSVNGLQTQNSHHFRDIDLSQLSKSCSQLFTGSFSQSKSTSETPREYNKPLHTASQVSNLSVQEAVFEVPSSLPKSKHQEECEGMASVLESIAENIRPENREGLGNFNNSSGEPNDIAESDTETISRGSSSPAKSDGKMISEGSGARANINSQTITVASEGESKSDSQTISDISDTLAKSDGQTVTVESQSEAISGESCSLAKSDSLMISEGSSSLAKDDNKTVPEGSGSLTKSISETPSEGSSSVANSDSQTISGVCDSLTNTVTYEGLDSLTKGDNQTIPEGSDNLDKCGILSISEGSISLDKSDSQTISEGSGSLAKSGGQMISEVSGSLPKSDSQTISFGSGSLAKSDSQTISFGSGSLAKSGTQTISEESGSLAKSDSQTISVGSGRLAKSDSQMISVGSGSLAKSDSQMISVGSGSLAKSDSQTISVGSGSLDGEESKCKSNVICRRSPSRSKSIAQVIAETSTNSAKSPVMYTSEDSKKQYISQKYSSLIESLVQDMSKESTAKSQVDDIPKGSTNMAKSPGQESSGTGTKMTKSPEQDISGPSKKMAKSHGQDICGGFTDSGSQKISKGGQPGGKVKASKKSKRAAKTNSNMKTETADTSTHQHTTTWSLTEGHLIQLEGLPGCADLCVLEDLVASCGSILRQEVRLVKDEKFVRFRLDSENACDLAVACLHDSDCVYPDARSVLICARV